LFTLFIAVEIIAKLSLEHINKFEKAIVAYDLQTIENLIILCCCFAEGGK